MRRLSYIALLFALSLNTPTWAQTDTLPDGLGETLSTPEGLRQIVESKDPRFVIVDVRPPTEYEAGHIPTAINIPGGLTADMKSPPFKGEIPGSLLPRWYAFAIRGRERCCLMDTSMFFVWGGITNWPFARERSVK